ncbi:hypothetical protein UFOVP349_27 [uncultured Caudovirales phage]|uniref:Uncharacterized protein n=1 Tax=uncultured Caudovirales phage TaxID=2100421 RepID=A0A6J5LZH6_9CAUD|nr:hypothetical protein UFOVP349_27 [uncultured Caudovirales phage]
MTRHIALRTASREGCPVVVPSGWGRFDYALPGGITASADTLAETEADIRDRGYTQYLLVKDAPLERQYISGVPA